MRFRNKFLLVAVCALLFAACKKWDDHTEVTNQDLKQNLLQAISADANLSKFREYIGKAGLDSLLQSSKTFTVWAPSNSALQTLDASIINDNTLLKNFILNHISFQSYFTRDPQPVIRVGMVNGKYNNFTVNTFDEGTILSADKFVSNGVLHTIDKFSLVLPNIWEFITSTTSQYAQNAYIKTLDFNSFDPSIAVIDSISSTTGLPIYHPGTGIVVRNRFNDRVYDMRREDKQYTYLVITDAGFKQEADSLKPYYAVGNTVATDSLTRWNTVKDLAFEGAYTTATIPPVLTSKFGTPVPVVPGFIVETKKMSNGFVYILSKVDVVTASKFKAITVEGENPTGSIVDRRGNTNYRVRYNPVTAKNFSDILVTGHGYSGFYTFYHLPEMPSMKYNVVGFAVNDFQTGAVTDSIAAANLTGTVFGTLPHVVPLYTATGAYNEVSLGQITVSSYGTLEIRLKAQGTNPIVLDYVRLVPVP